MNTYGIGMCENCNSSLPESFYYCMFGACAEEGQYVQNDWEVFMHFGRHSTGGPNDADIELVRIQNEVQKDIAFCTLTCMRQYFNNVFDKLDPSDLLERN